MRLLHLATYTGYMASEDTARIKEALDELADSGNYAIMDNVAAGDLDDLVELVAAAVGLMRDNHSASTVADEAYSTAEDPNWALVDGDSSDRKVADAVDDADQSQPDVALTTTKAAALLGVSRPFLINMLERGEMPFHKVGTARRVQLSDIKAYLAERDRAKEAFRQAALSKHQTAEQPV